MASHTFRNFVVYFLLFVLLFPLATVQASNSPDAPDNKKKEGPATEAVQTEPFPTDRIIIKFKRSDKDLEQDPASREKTMNALSQSARQPLNYVRAMSGNAHVIALPEKQAYEEVAAIAQALMARDDVEYAEPDMIRRHALVPNDPLYGNQWHYTSSSTVFGINLPAAWDITTGLANVVVVVP